MKILIIVIGVCFFLSSSFGAVLEKSVVDHHTHVACYGYQSEGYVSEAIKGTYKFKFYQKLFDFSDAEAKKKGDHFIFSKMSKKINNSKYVKAAVILAIDQVYNKKGELKKEETEFYVPNSFVSENVKKFSNLEFGASVHPYRLDALNELEKVKRDGAKLVKLLPAIHNFAADDPKISPYYQKLVELDLPLLIHMDEEHSFSRSNNAVSDPMMLDLPLKLGVKVICPHAASNGESKGEKNYKRLLRLAKKYPNLYIDNSALNIVVTRKYHLPKVIPHWENHRIYYGSDYPLISSMLTSPWYYVFRIGFSKALEISRLDSLWDRDIELKRALGMPDQTFSNYLF